MSIPFPSTEPLRLLTDAMRNSPLLKIGLSLAASGALGILLLVPDPFALLGFVSDSGRDAVKSAIPDKVQHAVSYAVLTGILATAFSGSIGRRMAWACGLAFLHGASTEWLQRFIPNRQCDWKDLLANAVGIAAASLVGMAVFSRTRSPYQTAAGR